jgi:chromosome partitioning protein
MQTNVLHKEDLAKSLRLLVERDATELVNKLHAHQLSLFPPTAQKQLRRFTSAETAKFLGINEGYIRVLAAQGKAPLPEPGANGRRTFSAEEMNALRVFLDEGSNRKRLYIPHRSKGDKLQVLTVMNFKGGSGKTTTSTHLAQYLALKGYRVLAIDLDPQASMSAMFGYQPEFDASAKETIYGAIRYDDERCDIADVVQSTYVPGLDLIPGNLELMEFEHTTPTAVAQGSHDFYARLQMVLEPIADQYDVVVIDCPPQLGYLTLSALYAATSVLITVHPQMMDVMSMAQFLRMTQSLLEVIHEVAGVEATYDWMAYLVTRYEPTDGPQNQMVGFMRALFGQRVLNTPMLKSTAIADAGLTKQTLYEVDRSQFNKGTYDRALESLNTVNGEIEELIRNAWGRA